MTNLVLLCLPCHRGVHRAEGEAALTGWLVWTALDTLPVRLLRGWALLVPDGSVEPLEEDEARGCLDFWNSCSQAS